MDTVQAVTLPKMRYDEELQDYRDKLRQERNTHLRHINYNYSLTRNLAVVVVIVSIRLNRLGYCLQIPLSPLTVICIFPDKKFNINLI